MPSFSMSVWIVTKYYHFLFWGGGGTAYDQFILGLGELTQLDEECYVGIKAEVPKIFTLFLTCLFYFGIQYILQLAIIQNWNTIL